MLIRLIPTGAIIAATEYLVKSHRKEHWLAIGPMGLIPGLIFLWVGIATAWQPCVMMAYILLIIGWILAVSPPGRRFDKPITVDSDRENEN